MDLFTGTKKKGGITFLEFKNIFLEVAKGLNPILKIQNGYHFVSECRRIEINMMIRRFRRSLNQNLASELENSKWDIHDDGHFFFILIIIALSSKLGYDGFRGH